MSGMQVRAELRKTFSTRLWWALLIPVAALSVLLHLFGGLFSGALGSGALGPGAGGAPPLLLFPLAAALALASVFATVAGIVASAGEFRHRTVTTTYLTSRGRGTVLLASMAASGLVGALYAATTALVGVPVGLLGGATVPGVGPLLAVAGIGVVVCALWGALGAALGTLTGNQVGALVGALVYLLFGELLLSSLLNDAEAAAVRPVTSFLPGNAGDIALYDIPAELLSGAGSGLVEGLAGVTAPPPWWAALLVLAAWTAAAAAAARLVGGRRDIT